MLRIIENGVAADIRKTDVLISLIYSRTHIKKSRYSLRDCSQIFKYIQYPICTVEICYLIISIEPIETYLGSAYL